MASIIIGAIIGGIGIFILLAIFGQIEFDKKVGGICPLKPNPDINCEKLEDNEVIGEAFVCIDGEGFNVNDPCVTRFILFPFVPSLLAIPLIFLKGVIIGGLLGFLITFLINILIMRRK